MSIRTAHLVRFVPAVALVLLPLSTRAATFAEIVNSTIVPLGNAFIVLLYSIAFIIFLIGMVRYFFTSGEEGREKGKQLAFWGIIALVVLFGVWGLVQVLLGVLTSFSA
ncbi:MAG: hypothetical protein V4480_04000 [Patescibacteria group bacterium]